MNPMFVTNESHVPLKQTHKGSDNNENTTAKPERASFLNAMTMASPVVNGILHNL